MNVDIAAVCEELLSKEQVRELWRLAKILTFVVYVFKSKLLLTEMPPSIFKNVNVKYEVPARSWSLASEQASESNFEQGNNGETFS